MDGELWLFPVASPVLPLEFADSWKKCDSCPARASSRRAIDVMKTIPGKLVYLASSVTNGLTVVDPSSNVRVESHRG